MRTADLIDRTASDRSALLCRLGWTNNDTGWSISLWWYRMGLLLEFDDNIAAGGWWRLCDFFFGWFLFVNDGMRWFKLSAAGKFDWRTRCWILDWFRFGRYFTADMQYRWLVLGRYFGYCSVSTVNSNWSLWRQRRRSWNSRWRWRCWSFLFLYNL